MSHVGHSGHFLQDMQLFWRFSRLVDDFDDYNGFTKWITGDSIFFRSADFLIRDSVDYVTISGHAVVSSASRTYHKRLRVWVSSPFMRDTLQFATVYSYWYFR